MTLPESESDSLMKKIPLQNFSSLTHDEALSIVWNLKSVREESMKKKPKAAKKTSQQTKSKSKSNPKSRASPKSSQQEVSKLAKLIEKLSPEEIENLRSQIK